MVVAHSPGCEVIVADNASTDTSVQYLQEHFPTVRVIRHTKNLGFCEGYNEALKQVDATYYVLLNSDVAVTPNWIGPVVSLMDADRRIGVSQPKIKAQLQPDLFEYAGAAGGLLDSLGYPYCRGRLFEHIEKDTGQYNDIKEVFWATGACMFVRASVYHALGGLEPAFFAHMEEIDFCWRAKNAGYKIMYNGHSQVFHVGGGTLHKSNPRKTYLNFRNGLALLYKNLPASQLVATLVTRVLLDWLAAGRMLVYGQKEDAQAVLNAHVDLIRNGRYWHRRRKAQPHKGTFPDMVGVFKGSIVWEYFIRRKESVQEL